MQQTMTLTKEEADKLIQYLATRPLGEALPLYTMLQQAWLKSNPKEMKKIVEELNGGEN